MDSNLETLFISYLEKTISSKDEKKLIVLIQNNPEIKKELIDFQKIWNASGFIASYNEEFVAKEWDKLIKKANPHRDVRTKSKGIFLYWLPRIAAIFMLGAIFSFAISYKIYNPNSKNLTFHEINTPPGAKSKVSLPDGSVIWLNAGSTIKYSNHYGKNNREVELTGEAFFNVKADPGKVFLVQTSEINVKAYGTEFNVKSYPEEGTIEATLIKGSIGVTRIRFKDKKNDEVMLEPNQRVVYYRKSDEVEKSNAEPNKSTPETPSVKNREQKLTYLISKGIDPVEFTSWKDGTLFITSETLAELAVILERKYDVKIHFEKESMKNLKFTGSLENETVEQVIEAIGIAAKLDYELDEREIWFKEQAK